MTLIELKSVCKSLGGQRVLDRLDLAIDRGETLVIMGRSGAGKSVILKHIIGLMKPDSGEVLFDGQRIDTLSRHQLNETRKRFGMLFQGSALFDSMSVQENVCAALRRHKKLSPGEVRRIVAAKLEAVGLSGIEEKMPDELSGGMRKRVGLARAIAMDPEVVLYDEPTTGLDPITAHQINDLILQTRSQFGVTSVVVTHDVTNALKVGTRVCLLVNGKINFSGRPDEVRNTDNPYVRQFLEARGVGPVTAAPSA
ncbi:MAG: ABC transporter ATP-binding protein [Candidatus Glassbacteria bacterium]|nr:ABC transporter ATP-binding protein [Candidatus Glassbacteria bacterium]